MNINIYQMYHENNCKFGFYVQRNSWAQVCAKITDIYGVFEGQRIKGAPPYFDNPKVRAEFYDLDKLTGELKFKNKGFLSSAGTFQYILLT